MSQKLCIVMFHVFEELVFEEHVFDVFEELVFFDMCILDSG